MIECFLELLPPPRVQNILTEFDMVMKSHPANRFISSFRTTVLVLFFSLFSLLSACGGGGGSDPEPTVLVGGLSLSGGAAGDLYVLNSDTGEVLGFLDTSADCGGTPCEIGSIRSSVYDSASQSLIVGTSNSTFCTGCIIQIDLTTFVGTILWDNATLQAAVGADFNVSAVPGMTMRSDGQIFATVKQGAGGPVGLIRFTRTTSPTYIGLTGVAASVSRTYDLGNGIAFWPDGTLYYTTGAGLSTIDTSTAVATNIGDLTYDGITVVADPDFTKVGGLVLTPAWKLVGILDNDGAERFFGTLAPDTRTFSTTEFYAGDSIETVYGLNNLGGLGVIPERFTTGNITPLP